MCDVAGTARIHDDLLVGAGLEGRGQEELHALVEEDILVAAVPDGQRRVCDRLEEDEESLGRRGEAHGGRKSRRRRAPHIGERARRLQKTPSGEGTRATAMTAGTG